MDFCNLRFKSRRSGRPTFIVSDMILLSEIGTLWQSVAHDPTAVATFALAAVTLLLAFVTCAAIIIPIRQHRQEAVQSAERSRRELSSLLLAVRDALSEQLREPAWSAAGGIDIVVARLLSRDLLDAVSPTVAQEIVEATMRAQRSLHNDDMRAKALALQRFETISDTARGAQAAVTAAREQVNFLCASRAAESSQ